jgi:hypothetical protein
MVKIKEDLLKILLETKDDTQLRKVIVSKFFKLEDLNGLNDEQKLFVLGLSPSKGGE